MDADDFDIIFHQNMDETPIGPYTREQWAEDWQNPPWANGVDNGDKTIIEEADRGGRKSRVMHWTFPEGSYGASSNHGYQWQTPLGGKY
ncbi:MAG: hypothetical protein KAT15_17600, partial [Bacteroidales bacterium]|nr:hypothetical protein [Bacteroidales bacterium]